MSETVTRGELVRVAKELNDVLKPDTPIDIKANAAKLDQQIREASVLLEEADEVTDETKAVLNTIGADMPESWKTEPEGEGGEEEQEETPPAEPERSEPVDTAADVKKAKAAKKVDDLQAIAKGQGIRIAPPFLKDLKKCRDYVVAKLEDLAENGRVIKPKKGNKSVGTSKADGTQSAKINAFINDNDGSSVADIVAGTGYPETRVKSHIYHLVKTGKAMITVKLIK